MDKEQILSELKNELCIGAHSLFDVCRSFLQFVDSKGLSEEEKIQYFEVFLSEIRLKDLTSQSSDDFFKTGLESGNTLIEILGLQNRVISNLIQSRVTVSDFYKSLWDKLDDPSLYPDLSTKAVFLQTLWMDSRIPYFQLGEGCSMENDEFKEIVQRIRPTIEKGFFILDASLKYKTERASLLMETADELTSKEERTVFWAVLISNLQQRSRVLTEKLKETSEENPPEAQ